MKPSSRKRPLIEAMLSPSLTVNVSSIPEPPEGLTSCRYQRPTIPNSNETATTMSTAKPSGLERWRSSGLTKSVSTSGLAASAEG